MLSYLAPSPDRATTVLSNGGHVVLAPAWLSADEASDLEQEFLRTADWEKHFFPRLVAWYGSFDYVYSGVTHRAVALTPTLAALRARVETFVFGESRGQYQGVLLNQYRDGRDSVGFHADDESMIRKDSPIASLSLGGTRAFHLAHHPPHGQPRAASVELALTHGSLLVMGGTIQRHWRHSVPKEPSVRAGRINLTFRQYKTG